MEIILNKLKKDFPALQFEAGDRFAWSPDSKKVVFKTTSSEDEVDIWSLLHEVGHALLGHTTYKSDFSLLQLEVEAWQKAKELGARYNHEIDPEHVEDCLDTYRDWLYKRSLCPVCSTSSLQSDERTYKCFNCGTQWHVSKSRLCRPYRLKHKQKEIKV